MLNLALDGAEADHLADSVARSWLQWQKHRKKPAHIGLVPDRASLAGCDATARQMGLESCHMANFRQNTRFVVQLTIGLLQVYQMDAVHACGYGYSAFKVQFC